MRPLHNVKLGVDPLATLANPFARKVEVRYVVLASGKLPLYFCEYNVGINLDDFNKACGIAKEAEVEHLVPGDSIQIVIGNAINLKVVAGFEAAKVLVEIASCVFGVRLCLCWNNDVTERFSKNHLFNNSRLKDILHTKLLRLYLSGLDV